MNNELTKEELKEIEKLYKKHNEKTKYKLEVEEIIFPKYIKNILNKGKKRTNIETKKLNKYRKKILYNLFLKSFDIELVEMEKKEEKNRIRHEKKKATKEKNNQNNPNKIKHFGIWKDKKDSLKINRDNYAIIDKKVHNKLSNFILEDYKQNPEKRQKYYDNEECTIYSDSWCEKHKNDCLLNFDYNMNFFAHLDSSDFNNKLNDLLNKYNARLVFDLHEINIRCCVYILVLDDYNQIYIGQTKRNLLEEINSHWNKKQPFDLLLCGRVDESVLSINSFGALDTTRIYFIPSLLEKIDELEKQLINEFDKDYMLNRVPGGIIFPSITVPTKRKLKKFDNITRCAS